MGGVAAVEVEIGRRLPTSSISSLLAEKAGGSVVTVEMGRELE